MYTHSVRAGLLECCVVSRVNKFQSIILSMAVLSALCTHVLTVLCSGLCRMKSKFNAPIPFRIYH